MHLGGVMSGQAIDITGTNIGASATTDTFKEQSIGTSTKGFEFLRDFVGRFNASVEEDGKKLNADLLVSKLKEGGAVNDELLANLSADDIRSLTELPPVVSKALVKGFTALSTKPTADKPKRRPTRYLAQTLELDDLVARYDPNDIGSAVSSELTSRIKQTTGRNARVIVFGNDGTVNVSKSVELIRDALMGESDLKEVLVDGEIHETFRVGEIPQRVVSIHPITGEPLRVNGIGSDQLDWSAVSLKAQQLLYFAVQSEELETTLSRRELVDYYNLAAREDGFGQLQNIFPEARRLFTQAEQLGELPKLKAFRTNIRQKKETSDRMLSSTRIR